jgi:hypothetical protein
LRGSRSEVAGKGERRAVFSEDIINRVRDSIDIVDLISGYMSLKKTGKNHVGLCPFHAEKTPSFNVNPDKQIFHCFGVVWVETPSSSSRCRKG